MGDSNEDMTAGVEHGSDTHERNSPASSVCYMNPAESQGTDNGQPENTDAAKEEESNEQHGNQASSFVPSGDESDSTPRSEVPSVLDTASTWDPQATAQQNPTEQSYFFSPQPLRYYSARLPTSATNSSEPSPTPSLNASSASVNLPHPTSSEKTERPATSSEHPDRPGVQRDLSSASTASVTTVRALSTEPLKSYTTPPKPHRDGPHYPNQSYAALQAQHYPPPYSPHILRTRSSHPSHYPSHSAAQISTFGIAPEQHRDIMESGSRTVGNSPASSPGLFSPQTPPLRHAQHSSEDQGYYSSPYLHYTHRQAPKETHVADVDVDPISGRKIINQYEVIDELGRGVHGKVKLGRNLETGVFVAIKIVDRYSKRRRLGKNTSHEDKIKREIAILKKARHPNIVSLLEVIDDPSRKKVYIVLEHVELGEVKWRTEGAKEVALVEWRRYQREAEGIFDNDAAAIEDEKIISLAHQRLEKREKQRLKRLHLQRIKDTDLHSWSFEHGGDSDDDTAENGRSSRASTNRSESKSESQHASNKRQGDDNDEGNMSTAFRTTTPTSYQQDTQQIMFTGLEGTMYGGYDTEVPRGRTPSLAGSSSSHYTDLDDTSDIPEHFRYVPLMTLDAARESFRDTVLGLEYLHYQGVIHRDIKPANLLQTKEHRIKISDFGVSYLGRGSTGENPDDQSESDAHDADEAIELAKTVGTPAFYAPELCQTDADADTPPVTGKIDVWALGVTLYCLVFGRVPFHDNNTFALMRLITDTEVYTPRYRLKAVAEKSGSRPSSHGRFYNSITSNKRAPHDLEYEQVDDDLHDLIKRLLIKDPRKRITLKEIKHHPWLLQGIDNKVAWVEETDPTRTTQGRRIEVSKDEVEKAVVPITLIDRVRSGVRKTLNTVMSLGTRGASRRRAQSSATGDAQQSLSAASSSSTISQDGRRPSLGLNESIFAALKSSREGEHPLAQSVTASPEGREISRYFDGNHSRSHSPAYSIESTEHPGPLGGSSRPAPPERAYSTMSTATSVRTIRQSDIQGIGRSTSPLQPPALPGTPTALDTPGGSNLGGIFGGVPRRLVNSVRSRERTLKPPQGSEHGRAKSIDRLVGADDDAHGGPSVALSNAIAAGHVDPPPALKEMSPTVGSSGHLSSQLYPDPVDRASSRQSSISSASSRLNHLHVAHDATDMEVGPLQASPGYPFPPVRQNSYDDRFDRAKDEMIRQRVQEETQGRERARSSASGTNPRPFSTLSQTACPPSPDDEVFFERQRLDDLFNEQHPGETASHATSPFTGPISAHSTQSRGLTSSSSEDHFTSMSQSTSNPSIPSVISANSSVAPEDCFRVANGLGEAPRSSEDTYRAPAIALEDYAGYDGDHPVESEDDDDSDDDFIVMTKKKPTRSGSISNAELSRQRARREINSHRRRSTRSGSNGTVKKIRPSEDIAHED